MSQIVVIILPFFALIGSGYAAGKLRVINEEGLIGLNAFVYYFALPALLFRVLAIRPIGEIINLPFLAAWAMVGLTLYFVVMLLGKALFGSSLGETALQGLAVSFSNSGYLGIPLATSLLGEGAAVPIALTMVADMTLNTPLTIFLIEMGRSGGKGAFRQQMQVVRTTMLNPFVLSIWGGILFSATGWQIVGPIDSYLQLLGSAAGPCALFALGATLSRRKLEGGMKEVGFMVGGKLVLHPMIVLLVLNGLFKVSPMWIQAALLNAALPSASTVYVVAQRYGLYVAQSSAAILLSTVVSIFTVTGLIYYLYQ